MGHDWAVLASIGGVVSISLVALVLGVGDGVVASAVAALVTLAGVKVALREGRRLGKP